MSTFKVVLITGASRGIGLAVAQYLLKGSSKVYLVARSSGPLEKLKEDHPGRVEFTAGDLSDFSVGPKAVKHAVEIFGHLDSLIVNHGALSPVKRIADMTPEEWRSSYDVNLFSAIAIIQPSLPHLRSSRGRIILTSSGAAVGAYTAWGPYGSAKAALNHIGMTLAVEEPSITTIVIRPGVVDTEMQAVVRSYDMVMDAKDVEKFKTLHESQKLLKPEQPGNVMARLALEGSKDLSGTFLSWDDKTLADYQDS